MPGWMLPVLVDSTSHHQLMDVVVLGGQHCKKPLPVGMCGQDFKSTYRVHQKGTLPPASAIAISAHYSDLHDSSSTI